MLLSPEFSFCIHISGANFKNFNSLLFNCILEYEYPIDFIFFAYTYRKQS